MDRKNIECHAIRPVGWSAAELSLVNGKVADRQFQEIFPCIQYQIKDGHLAGMDL